MNVIENLNAFEVVRAGGEAGRSTANSDGNDEKKYA